MINLGSAELNLALFWALLIAVEAAAFWWLPKVYKTGSFFAGYAAALVFASAGVYTAVSIVWERRLPLPLASQYASAWVNDLFNLCAVVGLLCVMHRRMPDGYHEPALWVYLSAGLAITAGFVFQFVIDKAYPSEVAWSPTHAAHSFWSVIVFAYLLLRGGPILVHSEWGFKAFASGNAAGIAMTAAVLFGVVAFFAVGAVLDVHVLHAFPWNAHGWYDWEKLRLTHKLSPQHPGWMAPEYLKNKGWYLAHYGGRQAA